ncbi:MAG: hypothetical protein ACPGJG_06745, partial [Candidatus Puniceispirillaceae bacterium]
PGPLVPNQMRYQAALHSDRGGFTPDHAMISSKKYRYITEQVIFLRRGQPIWLQARQIQS